MKLAGDQILSGVIKSSCYQTEVRLENEAKHLSALIPQFEKAKDLVESDDHVNERKLRCPGGSNLRLSSF